MLTMPTITTEATNEASTFQPTLNQFPGTNPFNTTQLDAAKEADKMRKAIAMEPILDWSFQDPTFNPNQLPGIDISKATTLNAASEADKMMKAIAIEPILEPSKEADKARKAIELEPSDMLMLVPLHNSLLIVPTLHLHFYRPTLKPLQLLGTSSMDASKEADRFKKALALEPSIPLSTQAPNLLPDMLMLVPLHNSLLHVLTLHLHFCRPVLKLLQLLVTSTVMDAAKEADRIKKALALEPSISRASTETASSNAMLLF